MREPDPDFFEIQIRFLSLPLIEILWHLVVAIVLEDAGFDFDLVHPSHDSASTGPTVCCTLLSCINDITSYTIDTPTQSAVCGNRMSSDHHLVVASEFSHPVEGVLGNVLPLLIGPSLTRPPYSVFLLWSALVTPARLTHSGSFSASGRQQTVTADTSANPSVQC